jgi:pyrroline-5-carboxylate reductase
MGGALLSGWLDKGLEAKSVIVRDPTPAPEVAQLIATRGIGLNFSVADIAARKPAVVVLAVKPQLMDAVLPELAALVSPDTLFISIAAGTSLYGLKSLLGEEARVVRAMPNTPSAVGRGMTVCHANPLVSAAQREIADALLSAVGDVGWVESEPLIDAVTAISGSGPAYVFYLTECLAAAGEGLGLEPALAMQLARATVAGAGEMLHLMPDDAATLRKNVTSPGGTTAAALDVLMGEGGLSPLLRRAATAARDRARELGQ